MADSKYGLSEKDRDIQRFLEKTSGDSKFKDMLKLIMEGNSTKKVDNFLRENREGSDFMQEIPGYLDPKTGNVIREDEIAGLPFPYNPAGLPDDLYQATQRQYGKKIFGPYTKEDAKLIKQYYSNKGQV
tara:strand:- start:63 stop:449 length:387 start_codon:yes stop_codon:yes gene_type:complete